MNHSQTTLFALSLFCVLLPQSLLLGEPKAAQGLILKEYSSQIDYPTKGDESLDIIYQGRIYHARVLHPEIVPGPHFSTALFWVGTEGEMPTSGIGGLVSAPTQGQGLNWHSLNWVSFFSESQGKPEEGGKSDEILSGFLAVDGQDNADWGASGLLYLYDGKACTLWSWIYSREPEEAKGVYTIVSANDPAKALPANWRKRLSPLLEKAEVAADYWPGP